MGNERLVAERETAAGVVIVVANVKTSLETLISPPPETVAVVETLEGGLAATFIVTMMPG